MYHSETDLYFAYCQLDVNERERFIEELSSEQRALLDKYELAEKSQECHSMTVLLGSSAESYFNQDYQLEGQLLGKYRIEEKLGSGGVGVVYAAQRDDDTFSQQLAIKLLKPALVNMLGKMAVFKEAQLLARLNHENIAKIYDGESVEQAVFIVMEKVDGQSLEQYLKLRTFELSELVGLFDKICSAIEHAHQRNVIHADIKPANILVSKQGIPKLIDFNFFAEGYDEFKFISAYSEGYASPEQINNEYLTHASDIYSLGKLLSAMLPEKNRELLGIIEKSTQTKASERYSSVSELRVDLQDFLSNKPLSVIPPTPYYLLKKFAQRKPVYLLFIVSLILSFAVFTQVLTYKNQQLTRENAVAESFLVELNELLYYSNTENVNNVNLENMLDLTRQKMLANPDISEVTKAKILASFILPTEHKKNRTKEK